MTEPIKWRDYHPKTPRGRRSLHIRKEDRLGEGGNTGHDRRQVERGHVTTTWLNGVNPADGQSYTVFTQNSLSGLTLD